MNSNRLFVINECFFSLPNNFDGSLGEALKLLADYTLEREKQNKVHDEIKTEENCDIYKNFVNNTEGKVSMNYNIYMLMDDGETWTEVKEEYRKTK